MEGILGQIMMFGGNFAPRNWALCDGQLLPIANHQALFSILGTTYGGDGRTTFALPDLRGRLPVHVGEGPGLTPRVLGERGGVENAELTQSQLPSHNHSVGCGALVGDQSTPENQVFAAAKAREAQYQATGSDEMSDEMLQAAGGGSPHPNVAPVQCIHYIICLVGIFPSRE